MAAAGAEVGASPNDGIAAVTEDSYICTPGAILPHQDFDGFAFFGDILRQWGFCCFSFDMLEIFMVELISD